MRKRFHPSDRTDDSAELLDYLWQKIGTDLFHFRGYTYLVVVDYTNVVVVDYFLRYPEIQKLSNTSHGIIESLKTIFS